MAKRGGFSGGMPGNMNNLMKQAQRMQRQMEETTKELEAKEYTATAGGGAVSVTVSGKKEVTAVKLSEEVVDPDDIEMLEDLIVAATNEAFRQMEEESSAAMSKLTGGLGGMGEAFLSNHGLLQQSDNEINRRAVQASRNRKQICAASGISYYQYAGRISNKPCLVHYRGEA